MRQRHLTRQKSPRPIDRHVGNRLCIRRKLMGLSQTALAETVGITFQQIQKYERGANRISAGMLYCLGQSLDVPPAYFFEHMPAELLEMKPSAMAGAEKTKERSILDNVMTKRETLELVLAYYLIANEQHRRKLLELIKSM